MSDPVVKTIVAGTGTVLPPPEPIKEAAPDGE